MSANTEPTLTCSLRGEAIAPAESLVAPLVAAQEAKYKLQLRAQADSFAQKERTLAEQQQANDQRDRELEAAN